MLPEDYLKQGFREYISFTLKEPVTRYSLVQVFQDVRLGPDNFLKRKCIFDNMILFGRDLSENLNIDLEMANCNGQTEAVRLYRQLVQYGQRRQNFAEALLFLKRRAEDVTAEIVDALKITYEAFNRVADRWTKIRMLLIKLFLTRKETLREKIVAMVKQIAIEELELLQSVIDIGRLAICN